MELRCALLLLVFVGLREATGLSLGPAPWLMKTRPTLVRQPALRMESALRVRRRALHVVSRLKGWLISVENLLLEGSEGREARAQALSDDDEISPTVLSDEICLVPGKPVVRVEVAPGNARRIFTGIDIVSEEPHVQEVVWGILCDYEHLDRVVPNLVANEVLSRTEDGGARLRQVGGAKLAPGIVFKATTTLDVKVYPEGLPSSMEAAESPDPDAELSPTSERNAAARAYGSKLPLTTDLFPRAYCISCLPHRDITMQGVAGASGDFSFYQGVWRIQALPGCAPEGSSAMRLTYR